MWAAFLPTAGVFWILPDGAAFGGKAVARGSFAGGPGEGAARVATIEAFEAWGYSREMRELIFAELGRLGFSEVRWIEWRDGEPLETRKAIDMKHIVGPAVMALLAADTGAGSGGAEDLYEHTVEFRNSKQGVEGQAGKLSTTTHVIHNQTYEKLLGVQKVTLGGVSDALFKAGYDRIGKPVPSA